MKNKRRNNLSKSAIALISVFAVLAVIGGVSAAIRLSKYGQTVEGNYIVNEEEKEEQKPIEDEEYEDEAASAVFVAKYIEQQVKGEMPDGADGKKVVYLTFDDGPSTTVTPRILDILEAEGVDATFFVLGKYVDENAELLKREVKEGNSIGIHSYSHDYNYLYPGDKINVQNCMADFEKTNESIKKVLGEEYKISALRFPGGYNTWYKNDLVNAEEVSRQMHEKGWYQIDWNCLSGDAEGGIKTADELFAHTVETVGTREKAVLLMHDTYQKEATAEALPRIIQYLKQQGYEFKTIK